MGAEEEKNARVCERRVAGESGESSVGEGVGVQGGDVEDVVEEGLAHLQARVGEEGAEGGEQVDA